MRRCLDRGKRIPDAGSPFLINVPKLDQPPETDVDERLRPLPHETRRRDNIDDRPKLADFKSKLFEPWRQLETDIRLAAGCAPARHDRSHEALEVGGTRRNSPRRVVKILVHDKAPSRLEGIPNSRQ